MGEGRVGWVIVRRGVETGGQCARGSDHRGEISFTLNRTNQACALSPLSLDSICYCTSTNTMRCDFPIEHGDREQPLPPAPIACFRPFPESPASPPRRWEMPGNQTGAVLCRVTMQGHTREVWSESVHHLARGRQEGSQRRSNSFKRESPHAHSKSCHQIHVYNARRRAAGPSALLGWWGI